jgi:hypothetical protein
LPGKWFWPRNEQQSPSQYLSGNLDDDSICEAGIIQFPNWKTVGGTTAHALFEIIPREEFARLMGIITSSSGIYCRPGPQIKV